MLGANKHAANISLLAFFPWYFLWTLLLFIMNILSTLIATDLGSIERVSWQTGAGKSEAILLWPSSQDREIHYILPLDFLDCSISLRQLKSHELFSLFI